MPTTSLTYPALLDLYDQALGDCRELVVASASADPSSPTPCEGWDLHDLLVHVVEENHRFAAAVTGRPAPPAPALTPTITVAAWEGSATSLRDTFARAKPDETATLDGYPPLPVEVLLRMQLLDTVVHSWDLARSLGRDHRPTETLVSFVDEFATVIAERSPDGTPGVFAAPSVPAGDDPWARALGSLGRTA